MEKGQLCGHDCGEEVQQRAKNKSFEIRQTWLQVSTLSAYRLPAPDRLFRDLVGEG